MLVGDTGFETVVLCAAVKIAILRSALAATSVSRNDCRVLRTWQPLVGAEPHLEQIERTGRLSV